MRPTYEELFALVQTLSQQCFEYQQTIKRLEKRVADLESQLKKNSKNSSKPPSSDQKPNIPPKPKKESRPYHPGASRQLLPDDQVTSREIRKIESCPRCHSEMDFTGEVTKWQQIELPEIKPLVHQIELHTCRCGRCGLKATPELAEHEKLLLGVRLEALINICLGQFRQSHQSVREFMATLIPSLELSQGLVSKIKARGAKALFLADKDIKAQILQSKEPIYMDATGWRHIQQNEHVIVMRIQNLVSFTVVSHQNKQTLADLVQNQSITHLVTDRGLAVSQIDAKIHQYCLAHLLRNIQGLAEDCSTSIEESQLLGEMHDLLRELFVDKHRLDRGEITEATWRQYGYAQWQSIEGAISEFLIRNPGEKVRRALERIQRDWEHFKVYLRSRNHPMTNNAAEEALRNLVIARKLCFGSRSSYGRRWRASIHSCIESLRRQGRSVLDFVAEALGAARMMTAAPQI